MRTERPSSGSMGTCRLRSLLWKRSATYSARPLGTSRPRTSTSTGGVQWGRRVQRGDVAVVGSVKEDDRERRAILGHALRRRVCEQEIEGVGFASAGHVAVLELQAHNRVSRWRRRRRGAPDGVAKHGGRHLAGVAAADVADILGVARGLEGAAAVQLGRDAAVRVLLVVVGGAHHRRGSRCAMRRDDGEVPRRLVGRRHGRASGSVRHDRCAVALGAAPALLDAHLGREEELHHRRARRRAVDRVHRTVGRRRGRATVDADGRA
eukprot:549527-Prymnesium_polylepis.1